MAFESITSGKSINPGKDVEVGDAVTGYLIGYRDGQHGKNLLMKIDGETYTVFSSGNIKYLIRDNLLKVGALTKITRKPNEKVKGMTSSKFEVEQDKSDTVEVADFQEVFDSEENAPPSSTKAAADRGIAAQTARLAGAVGGRK